MRCSLVYPDRGKARGGYRTGYEWGRDMGRGRDRVGSTEMKRCGDRGRDADMGRGRDRGGASGRAPARTRAE